MSRWWPVGNIPVLTAVCNSSLHQHMLSFSPSQQCGASRSLSPQCVTSLKTVVQCVTSLKIVVQICLLLSETVIRCFCITR